jgi:hypothetical protein
MFPKEVVGLVYIDPTDFMQTGEEMQSVFAKAGVKNGHGAMETMNKQLWRSSAGEAAENRARRSAGSQFRDRSTDVPMTVFRRGKGGADTAGGPHSRATLIGIRPHSINDRSLLDWSEHRRAPTSY